MLSNLTPLMAVARVAFLALVVPASALAPSFPPISRYQWRGHSCAFRCAGEGPPILLLHGFAGSAFNCWRSTLPALAETHTVYGLDLLGLGASDQPGDVEYSIDLWREQADDFIKEQILPNTAGGDDAGVVLIGHSFGSVIALEVARALRARDTPARAVGMMNCGVGMNNMGVSKVQAWRESQRARGVEVEAEPPDWQFAVFGAVVNLINFIVFEQKWLLSIALENFATRENVRGALAGSVYVDAARVTDDLVDDYLTLANNREAAVEVLRQIYTNDSGPLPFRAAAELPDDFPILAVWGDNDNLASIDGPVGRYFRKRATEADGTRFEEISAGHVPQDDKPELTNRILKEWLESLT